jgi:sulfate transporter 4
MLRNSANPTSTSSRSDTIIDEMAPLFVDDDIELPLVSASDSEILRDKLFEDPKGIHQIILRNTPLCYSNDGKTLWKRIVTLFQSYFPILIWIWDLTRSKVLGDIMAGITIGIMLIPQSMSYAQIAGLQSSYGLYAGFMPLLIYSFMGTSRQLAVGPTALISLLTASGLDKQLTKRACPALYAPYPSQFPDIRLAGVAPAQGIIPQECGFEYFKLAILLSFLVGIIQLSAGLLRAGYLVSFVGHPVVSGFTSGSALTIGLSQLKYLVGYSIPREHIYGTLYNLFKNISSLKYMPFILGIVWTAILIGFKQGLTRYPDNKFYNAMKSVGPLLLCAIGIGIIYAAPVLKTDQFHVDVVGKVDANLNDIYSGSNLEFQNAPKLISSAFTISLIGFMESISIAKTVAAQHGYAVVPNQELVALGAANIAGSFFSAYPTAGSFSRSAVNNSAGAQTLISGMVSSMLMLLTIGVLAPALQNLPQFYLAAIVISSVIGLFAYKEAIMMWKVKKSDFLLWIVAFLATIFFGAEYGLGVAVGLSLLIVIYESVTPQLFVLWSIPNTSHYRHVRQPEKGNFIRGVLIVRIGTSSMYFANSNTISTRLEEIALRVNEENSNNNNGTDDDGTTTSSAVGDIKYIVLDMTPVITIDTSALQSLEDMHQTWKSRGVQICFANCSTRVLRTMDFAQFQEDIISKEWFLPDVQSAVKYCIKYQMNEQHRFNATNNISRLSSEQNDDDKPYLEIPVGNHEYSSEILTQSQQIMETNDDNTVYARTA